MTLIVLILLAMWFGISGFQALAILVGGGAAFGILVILVRTLEGFGRLGETHPRRQQCLAAAFSVGLALLGMWIGGGR
jgi:hypothetical protein